MGFWDNRLHSSELAIFEPLVAYLALVESEVLVSLGDIHCGEKPSFQHKGIVLKWPNRETLSIHRCRNVWISSRNSMGLDQEPFEMQFANASEARAWLSLLISQRRTSTIDEGAHGLKTDARHDANAAPAFSYSRKSLTQRVPEVKEILEDLLMRSSGNMDPIYCSEKASELADQWLREVIRESQGEEDELLGSLWLKSEPAKTEHGAEIHADLDSRAEWLTAEHVRGRDIQLWWDLPVWRRQLNIVENDALFDSRFRIRYQAQVSQTHEAPPWQMEMMAYRQARCTVPMFSLYSGSEKIPWELYNRANDFLLRELRDNPKFELEAIEAGSFNALFRSKELEI